ncbi:hypothetical protein ACIBG7_23360 [Nonomuraea sp. NPDC050328]|uniref:hypothetical protein n=1 Tax=Nonomuraea sp. NPDC050328 TaxID=3364361 RepID=UPI00379168B0
MRRSLVLGAAGLGAAAVAGAAMFLTGGAAPEAAQVARVTPAPGDPLTPDEVRRAGEIAGASSRAHMAAGRVELLYVERDDDKAAEPNRRAEAYLYDYAEDAVIVRTVDLGRGTVVRESKGTGVQPPPSKREEVRAAELLLAHPKLGKGVRSEFRKAAGRELRSAADLSLRGLIFRDKQGACRTHRCVRLFVRLPDGRFLDTSRIVVDLSAKTVHILEW